MITVLDSQTPYLVRELLDENGWINEKLQSFFTHTEVEAIKLIPLPVTDADDRWTWKFSRDGNFTVKSAYYVDLQRLSEPESSIPPLNSDRIWKLLWKANVPPKIKSFGWRVMQNGVPVMKNLECRGMSVDTHCPLCGENVEDLEHLLMRCPASIQFWKVSPLRLEIQDENHVSAQEWIRNLASNCEDIHWWSLFWSLAWGIWLQRNAWVFEKKKSDLQKGVQYASNLVLEYLNANENKLRKTPNPICQQVWKAPTQPWFKLNSDAAIHGENKIGCGAVLRDSVGDVLMATCVNLDGEGQPDVAEALALRHGLKTTLEAGFHRVILETDCLKLANQLRKGKGDNSTFGMIVNDILNLTKCCSNFSISHVGRNGNFVAHSIAKNSVSYEEMRVWLEECPPHAQGFVIADCMLLDQ